MFFLFKLELHNKEKIWEQKYIDQQRLYEHSERQVMYYMFSLLRETLQFEKFYQENIQNH